MNVPKWPWIFGAILVVCAVFIGGVVLGRSSSGYDYRAAVARYDRLRAADDGYIGDALRSVGSALKESDRLAKSGSDIESTVRSIAVLVNGIRDCVGALQKAQASRIPGSP